MTEGIRVISLRTIYNLSKYFAHFDFTLVEELQNSAPPDEREITRRLRQMIEKEVNWRIDDLNSDEWLDQTEGTTFRLEMQTHPTGWENQITYADYGIVFSFTDEVLGGNTETTAYLIQAKRLYDNGRHSRYDLYSEFGGQKDWQTLAIRHLASYLGEEAVKFAAYCPVLSAYDANSAMTIRKFHEANASALYTGTPFGVALSDSISRRPENSSHAGVWISPTSLSLHRSVDLHRTAFLESLPFGWFVIANLWNLAVVGNEPGNLVSFGPPPFLAPWVRRGLVKHLGLNLGQDFERQRLVLGLARGDVSVAREIAKLSEGRLPASTFLPSVSVEIHLTRSLSLELRPSIDDDPSLGDDPDLRRPGK